MLEALLLTAVTMQAAPRAQGGKATPPSLELLEFLGEFGDDEEGLFDGEAGSDVPRTPATDARAGKRQPGAKSPPATPPSATPSPTAPGRSKASP